MVSSHEARTAGILLFMGKLDPLKGVRPLLKACRAVPDVKLVLAGRVDEQFAAELRTLLPHNARYVGQKIGRTAATSGRRDVDGAPSLCYENQPFSILEAFACGKPVIARTLEG